MAASTLPIFPLPLVLFPGVTIPLHIFEPRYRSMLADCLERDRRFGIVFLAEGASEETLGIGGDVGCVAHVLTHEELADGRSNITVAGRDRFTLRAYVTSPLPYHLGMVVPYEDAPEPVALLEPLATRVRERFERIARAARTISDDEDAIPTNPLAKGRHPLLGRSLEHHTSAIVRRAVARTHEPLALDLHGASQVGTDR